MRAYALVDDADLEKVSRFRWHLRKDGYVERGRGVEALHHLILGRGADHRNGDKLDNRRKNLRRATQAQNSQNRRVSRRAASGVRGVSRSGPYGWKATAQIGGISHYLGYFTTIEKADVVVKAWRAKHMPFSIEAAA